MKIFLPAILLCSVTLSLRLSAETSLSIYNQDFAIVRETLPLNLHPGLNDVRYSNVALYAEPNSVILRDPAGKADIQVIEQSFRGGAVTQDTMLSWFEGQTIDFVRHEQGKSEIIQGKVVRSGRDKPGSNYGSNPDSSDKRTTPIIEVNDKYQFELPGTPLFPKLEQGAVVKPEFDWKVQAAGPTQLRAEVAYTTFAIHWFADYNIIAAEENDTLQILGWMTIDNQTGKSFENTKVKLVAGMIGKMDARAKPTDRAPDPEAERTIVTGSDIPVKAEDLDEYYVYSHPQPISLKDREEKQIEFLRAEGVQSKRVYVYDGAVTSPRPTSGGADLDFTAGTDSSVNVAVTREFKNNKANHLGVPLPKGRMRYFRRSSDGQLEFLGEYDTPSTAVDETVMATTGSAFNLVAERTRPNFDVDPTKHTADESFEIKLRNHKKETVEIRVVEHLTRWSYWEIPTKSDPFTKKNSHAIEFNVPVKPGEERKVSYTVRYTKLPLKNADQ